MTNFSGFFREEDKDGKETPADSRHVPGKTRLEIRENKLRPLAPDRLLDRTGDPDRLRQRDHANPGKTPPIETGEKCVLIPS